MSGTVEAFDLSWLFWLVLGSSAYAALLFIADSATTAWHRRQLARQELRQKWARMDQDIDASVRRIGAAFAVAQRLVREEAGRRVRS